MIVGIIQARMGSTRLPGKLMRPLHGSPMLEHVVRRLQRTKRIDSLIVATTDSSRDDVVVALAKELGAGCYRGSEDDVLDRHYHAAKEAGAKTVVRITSDCPLHDPAVVDLVIDHFLSSRVDYTITPANFPEGLDTEVFRFSALEAAWKEATLPSEREHVTLFIRNHSERFIIDPPWRIADFDHHTYHWSVDTEADFRFVEKVYQYLYDKKPDFGVYDVIELLEQNPELLEINKGATGYEGLQKSIREDAQLKKRHE